EFRGGSDEEATATGPAQRPGQPPLQDRPEALLAARGRQARPDHCVDELPYRGLDHRELERLLRSEVREEPGLGHLELVGELPYGEAIEADRCSDADGTVEDHTAGFFALGHARTISTIVLICPLGSWGGAAPRQGPTGWTWPSGNGAGSGV